MEIHELLIYSASTNHSSTILRETCDLTPSNYDVFGSMEFLRRTDDRMLSVSFYRFCTFNPVPTFSNVGKLCFFSYVDNIYFKIRTVKLHEHFRSANGFFFPVSFFVLVLRYFDCRSFLEAFVGNKVEQSNRKILLPK